MLIEVSPGELIDKLTILEIKLKNIHDTAKLANIQREYQALSAVCAAEIDDTPEIRRLRASLKAINERLWVVEDEIRNCERDKDFDARFIALARDIYQRNDQRTAVKRALSELLNSTLVEEKCYAAY